MCYEDYNLLIIKVIEINWAIVKQVRNDNEAEGYFIDILYDDVDFF